MLLYRSHHLTWPPHPNLFLFIYFTFCTTLKTHLGSFLTICFPSSALGQVKKTTSMLLSGKTGGGRSKTLGIWIINKEFEDNKKLHYQVDQFAEQSSSLIQSILQRQSAINCAYCNGTSYRSGCTDQQHCLVLVINYVLPISSPFRQNQTSHAAH